MPDKLYNLVSRNVNANQEKELQTIHSPETGFLDIKPLELKINSFTSAGLYFLLVLAALFLFYFIKEHFRFRSIDKKQKLLPPEMVFKNALAQIKIDAVNLDFRAYCESLSLSLKNLLSSYLGYKISPLTVSQLRTYLKNNSSNSKSNQIKDIQLIENICKLLSSLEGGEYGDLKTVSSLQEKKEVFFEKVEEVGNQICLLLDNLKKDKIAIQRTDKPKLRQAS